MAILGSKKSDACIKSPTNTDGITPVPHPTPPQKPLRRSVPNGLLEEYYLQEYKFLHVMPSTVVDFAIDLVVCSRGDLVCPMRSLWPFSNAAPQLKRSIFGTTEDSPNNNMKRPRPCSTESVDTVWQIDSVVQEQPPFPGSIQSIHQQQQQQQQQSCFPVAPFNSAEGPETPRGWPPQQNIQDHEEPVSHPREVSGSASSQPSLSSSTQAFAPTQSVAGHGGGGGGWSSTLPPQPRFHTQEDPFQPSHPEALPSFSFLSLSSSAVTSSSSLSSSSSSSSSSSLSAFPSSSYTTDVRGKRGREPRGGASAAEPGGDDDDEEEDDSDEDLDNPMGGNSRSRRWSPLDCASMGPAVRYPDVLPSSPTTTTMTGHHAATFPPPSPSGAPETDVDYAATNLSLKQLHLERLRRKVAQCSAEYERRNPPQAFSRR